MLRLLIILLSILLASASDKSINNFSYYNEYLETNQTSCVNNSYYANQIIISGVSIDSSLMFDIYVDGYLSDTIVATDFFAGKWTIILINQHLFEVCVIALRPDNYTFDIAFYTDCPNNSQNTIETVTAVIFFVLIIFILIIAVISSLAFSYMVCCENTF